MSKYTIEDTTLTSIANAIREKTGKSEKLLPNQMPDEIKNIQTGGESSIEIEDYINTIPTSNASSSASFIAKNIKKIPQLDLSNLTDMRYFFFYAGMLTEVEGELDIGFSSNNTGICGINRGSAPSNLETIKLKNLNADIDLHYCTKLTKESLLYLFNNAHTVSSGTITLGSTLLAKLTDEDIKIATDKGWIVN